MEKWEYKTLKIKASTFVGPKLDERQLDSELNNLGEQGWELVSTMDTNKHNGITDHIVCVFKRTKS